MPIVAESVSKTTALADRVPVADIATAQNAKVRVLDHRFEGERGFPYLRCRSSSRRIVSFRFRTTDGLFQVELHVNRISTYESIFFWMQSYVFRKDDRRDRGT